jgi:hypothetical protein
MFCATAGAEPIIETSAIAAITIKNGYKAWKRGLQFDVILLFMILLLGFNTEAKTCAWPLGSRPIVE